MAVSLLEILRSVPDHRRREGRRFERATVLLCAILGMVTRDNSYRQLHEFISVHRHRHAASIEAPPSPEAPTAIAVDGKTLRGSFDAFCDRKAAHMLSALRQADQIVLGHLMVEEKSNEIPPWDCAAHRRRHGRPISRPDSESCVPVDTRSRIVWATAKSVARGPASPAAAARGLLAQRRQSGILHYC